MHDPGRKVGTLDSSFMFGMTVKVRHGTGSVPGARWPMLRAAWGIRLRPIPRCTQRGPPDAGPRVPRLAVSGAKQLAERFGGGERGDGRTVEVPDVARDDVPCAAGPCGGNLHGVLEVPHRQLGRVTHRPRIGRRDLDKAGQLDNEVTRARAAARRRHEIVEVRDGMPGDEGALPATLEPIQQFRGSVRVRVPIQRDVDQDVGVEKYQRYFRARASWRGSS